MSRNVRASLSLFVFLCFTCALTLVSYYLPVCLDSREAGTKRPQNNIRIVNAKFSPDGEKIALLVADQKADVNVTYTYLYAVKQGKIRRLSVRGYGFSGETFWAPDAIHIGLNRATFNQDFCYVSNTEEDSIEEQFSYQFLGWNSNGTCQLFKEPLDGNYIIRQALKEFRVPIQLGAQRPYWTRDSKSLLYVNAEGRKIIRHDLRNDSSEDIAYMEHERVKPCLYVSQSSKCVYFLTLAKGRMRDADTLWKLDLTTLQKSEVFDASLLRMNGWISRVFLGLHDQPVYLSFLQFGPKRRTTLVRVNVKSGIHKIVLQTDEYAILDYSDKLDTFVVVSKKRSALSLVQGESGTMSTLFSISSSDEINGPSFARE